MIDFSKLNDPGFRTEVQSRILEEQEQMALQRKTTIEKIHLLMDAEATLSETENSFVISVHNHVVVKWLAPTEAQTKWMDSLCRRVREQSGESTQQVRRFFGHPRNS